MRTSIIALSALAATVSAHGNLTSPPARVPGAGMAAACGQQAVDTILADGTAPIENIASSAAPTCNTFLCRGAVFEDNRDKVQNFTAGQVVPMKANVAIPHEGPCNVSIVKTATNTILGQPLLFFASYADEKLAQLPANNTDFSVTIPADIAATDCRVAGECVLQWWWFGTGAKQTYESCVDFMVVDAAGAPAGAPAPACS